MVSVNRTEATLGLMSGSMLPSVWTMTRGPDTRSKQEPGTDNVRPEVNLLIVSSVFTEYRLAVVVLDTVQLARQKIII